MNCFQQKLKIYSRNLTPPPAIPSFVFRYPSITIHTRWWASSFHINALFLSRKIAVLSVKYYPGLYMIGYWTRKIFLKSLPFLCLNEESQEREIQNKIIYTTIYHWFEFSRSWLSSFKYKKGRDFKINFLVQYPIIYNPGLHLINLY